MNRSLLLSLLLLPAVASAQTPAWHCRNPDLEASCADGRCTATPAGEFTPMDIAFDENGSISACAYSGCWEGEGEPGGDARYFTLVARRLVFQPVLDDPPRQGDLALVLDRDRGVAVLSMDPYAQPLQCRRQDRS